MFEGTPWFMGGGAEHSPAVARQVAFSATQGATGVILPGDLKVSALPVPGSSVRISTGSGVMKSRYPGAVGQSYMVRSPTATDVPVTATGTGGTVVKYLIVRVTDPEFEGQIPADPVNHVYVTPEWVTSITGLTYPFLPLARLDQPENTATITNDMLSDEPRKVANPRRSRSMRLLYPAADKIMSKTGYESWPFSGVMSSIEIPDWATHLDIVASVSGAEILGTGTQAGGVRTVFAGDVSTQNGVILGPAGRQHTTTIGSHKITQAMRDAGAGDLILQGYQTVGSGSITADYQTSIAVDWEFSEVPE